MRIALLLAQGKKETIGFRAEWNGLIREEGQKIGILTIKRLIFQKHSYRGMG
jgi:hypothetical protein